MLCVYTYIINVNELVVMLNIRRELFWTVFRFVEFKPFTQLMLIMYVYS
jgi:hypothetical protein